jgi:DNA mismatch endonuclease (patch repair protein)
MLALFEALVRSRRVKSTPEPSSESVAQRMRNTAQRDTTAELALRRELHRRGFRYRVDRAIPGVTRGRPDLVFPTEKVAVFVDGCFWHSCPEHATIPTENRDWWITKLQANVDRDRRHDEELIGSGWLVLRFWEHDDPLASAAQVGASLIRRRASE